MRRRKLFTIVAVLAALVLTGCSATRPIANVDEFLFPSENVDKLSQVALEDIVVAAGSKLGWTFVAKAPGSLIGNKQVQAMAAMIDVKISADALAIHYLSSQNMSAADGKIEASYNQWIKLLKNEISDAVVDAAEE